MPVLTGLDVLKKSKYALLKGRRIGLVTNHTGLDCDGHSIIDLFSNAPDIELNAIFSPEHGIRGVRDEEILDDVDAVTGLPVYSLYGERKQPAQEQLSNIDVLVFDIQDIGCRFYTYISTLGNILEAAEHYGVPVIVLDRPNPITGGAVEGALPDDDTLSFTAYHTIPVRHGMTIGEIARLFQKERFPDCDLAVVSCDGWQRDMWYDTAGLVWTNPSPNMRSLTAASLYPGVGLLEFTNVSVGRGTDTPFEVIGAPYIDPRQLAGALNLFELPGVTYVPVYFTPAASVFTDELCGGINVMVTNRYTFQPVLTGFSLAIALRVLYPDLWQFENYNKLLVNRRIFQFIRDEARHLAQRWEILQEIHDICRRDLEAFESRRQDVLLYD